MMKTNSIILGFALFSATLTADDNKGQDFETHKADALKHIEERITKMQEHKTCVSSASDNDQLKKCRESMKEFMHSERKEHMQKRRDRMDERMKKMEKGS